MPIYMFKGIWLVNIVSINGCLGLIRIKSPTMLSGETFGIDSSDLVPNVKTYNWRSL